MNKQEWNESKLGKMTFENICRFYSSDKNINFTNEPPFIRGFYAQSGNNQFAVRWNRHEANANFDSEGIANDYFILNGKCEIAIDGNIYKLQAGDWIALPNGKYNFKVISEGDFECISVYKLPDYIPKLHN